MTDVCVLKDSSMSGAAGHSSTHGTRKTSAAGKRGGGGRGKRIEELIVLAFVSWMEHALIWGA